MLFYEINIINNVLLFKDFFLVISLQLYSLFINLLQIGNYRIFHKFLMYDVLYHKLQISYY